MKKWRKSAPIAQPQHTLLREVKTMSLSICNKRTCTLAAIVVSVIIGVLTALLHITGVVTLTAAFLWVMFGYGAAFLAALVLTEQREVPLSLLIGILGTTLIALVLLAIGVTATSVLSAILAGLLLFFFTLTLGASACWVRQQSRNEN